MKPYKVVYNKSYGGFGLSDEGRALFRKLYFEKHRKHFHDDSDEFDVIEDFVKRHDPLLVQVVETLGERASASICTLVIKTLKLGNRYYITEYDGRETVHETAPEWTVIPDD